jgi:aspartate kinase
VDGIFTADPRKVPTARLLNLITPDEAAELTYYGSEVIHPFTMEQVIKAAIPIRIKNVENPSGHGTIIYPDSSTTGTETPPAVKAERPRALAMLVNGYHGANNSRKIPTAVTIKDSIIVLNIRSNRKTISHGFFARIFGTLDRYGIVVDLLATSETSISMAMNGELRKGLLDRVVKELQSVGEVCSRNHLTVLATADM